MKRIAKRTIVVYFVVGLFVALLGTYIFRLVTMGTKWAVHPMNKHLYSNGKLVNAGAITDRNGEILAETEEDERKYSKDEKVRKATVHALNRVQLDYVPELSGYNLINGTFSPARMGNDIELTLDSKLCVTALNALGDYSGVVAVCNYKTGELLCSVSTKTYDPTKKLKEKEKVDGIFLNRFTSGQYPPGSTFKLVTAACALENMSDDEIENYTVKCEGGCYVDGQWVKCSGNHGNVNLKEALAGSCNAYFAELTLKLGKDKMMKTAKEMGFNKQFTFEGNSVKQSSYKGTYKSDNDFAWSGIGQSTDIVNPYHMILLTSAIANDGKAKEIHIVKKVDYALGIPTSFRIRKTYNLLNADIATELSDLMRNDVKNEYGDWRFKGLDFCAKTGTAQVDGQEATSWIVGFSRREDKPYAIVVVVEKGGYGITKAGNIANKVLQAAENTD